ncbi:hypothetical protein IFO70_35130 [Phormidium tenue FACHB-886]|nr:hypothetical protein [Phormidium tenue FACHB-886]
MLQEVFLESDWEDAAHARQRRDARMEELQIQGLLCTAENLWNVQGYRVYLVVATRDAPDIAQDSPRRERSQPQGDAAGRPVRRSRSTPSVEVR